LLALCLDTWVANVLVWIGVIGSYAASWLYFKAVWPQLRGGQNKPPAQNLNQS
jgi:hypothetical protein